MPKSRGGASILNVGLRSRGCRYKSLDYLKTAGAGRLSIRQRQLGLYGSFAPPFLPKLPGDPSPEANVKQDAFSSAEAAEAMCLEYIR